MIDPLLLQPLTGIPKGLVAVLAVLMLMAIAGGHWWIPALLGAGALGWIARNYRHRKQLDEPWPWPADFRAAVEDLARPIDPTPQRVLPPNPDAESLAKVVSTKPELEQLLAEQPPIWPWAVLASVVLQRRNTVLPRLRNLASGYQPRPGVAVSGPVYAEIALQSMNELADLLEEMSAFMLSPAFTGTLHDASTTGRSTDPDAVLHIAHRLMDYHEMMLLRAERCLQTPVPAELMTFVRDAGAGAVCPLIGYDRFIKTICQRVDEGRELLPYSRGGDMTLDDANLEISMPGSLQAKIRAQIMLHLQSSASV